MSKTKVTFEFPNGNKQTFETVGVVGAFILDQSDGLISIGGFATGEFTPNSFAKLAQTAVESVAKQMLMLGMTEQEAKEALEKMVPHAVDFAAVREAGKRMEQLEKGDNMFADAIAKLLNMTN